MRKLFNGIKYLFSIYIIAILFLTLFRLILFACEYGDIAKDVSVQSGLIFKAFVMGIRFDTVIACYILILPVVLICIHSFLKTSSSALYKGIHIWCCTFFSICLLLSAANIPYFLQFYKPINASVLNWAGELSFVTGMLFQEKSFLVYIVLFIVVDILFCSLAGYIKKRMLRLQEGVEPVKLYYGLTPFVCLLVCTVCFLGIRGRLARKSPIRIGTAYFCNNSFLNQLGLDPAFVFLRSVLDMKKEKNSEVHLMDSSIAIQKVAASLKFTDVSGKTCCKEVAGNDTLPHKNVVFILMEGFCTNLLDKKDRTSFVNDLVRRSIYFPYAFSAGIHTMNGVYGTLFSFPALLSQHPFKTGNIKSYNCWPAVMKQNGYHTLYFTTHDDQFDNIGGYLLANQVETITSQKDYPSEEIHSNLGVCDDYMFRRSIEVLNRVTQDGKPFFVTMMTASNHQPIVIPEYFTPKEGSRKDQVIEYSDWAIARFFEWAGKQPWYENTIFVLTGDHGSPAGDNLYDVSLAYHQVPLIIFQPDCDNPQVINKLAGQIDIFPTVMGMLGIPYRNETFGIDLFRETRPYMYFSSDDSYACVDRKYYYVNRLDGRESLYNYAAGSAEDSLGFLSGKAQEMKEYAASMIQAAQYIVKQKE